MLTMLALVRRQVGPLPHRRILLYERYVSTLIENWLEARSYGVREQSLDTLGLHEAESILIPLALWLQREKPSGTASQVEIREELIRIYLHEAGVEEAKADRPQRRRAEEQADRFLKEMRHMQGLLVERGHNAFGFLHLTFQEYFAGRALAQLDDKAPWGIIKPHRHDPRWREPILLCAGRLGVVENRRALVTRLVRQILTCEDDTEPYLHRNLLLALAIAADDVNLDPNLLAELGAAIAACLPTDVYALARALIRAAGQLIVNKNIQAEPCLSVACQTSDVRFQQVVCDALSEFAAHPGVRQQLLNRLDDENWQVRQAASNALSSVVSEDTEVRQQLLNRLSDSDYDVLQAAINALSSLVSEDTEVRQQLLNRLSDLYGPVRLAASNALVHADAFPTLVKDWWERLGAWLIADFDLQYTPSPQETSETLTAVQIRFAEVIGPRLPQDAMLRERVFAWLESSRMSARLGAMRALLQWPGGPPQDVIRRILNALNDRRALESYPARLTAASFLINRDPHSGPAIEVCLEALRYGTQPWEYLPRSGEIRKQAALVLGNLEPLHYDERVYESLLHVMQQDTDAETRDAAYGALVRLAFVRES